MEDKTLAQCKHVGAALKMRQRRPGERDADTSDASSDAPNPKQAAAVEIPALAANSVHIRPAGRNVAASLTCRELSCLKLRTRTRLTVCVVSRSESHAVLASNLLLMNSSLLQLNYNNSFVTGLL